MNIQYVHLMNLHNALLQLYVADEEGSAGVQAGASR